MPNAKRILSRPGFSRSLAAFRKKKSTRLVPVHARPTGGGGRNTLKLFTERLRAIFAPGKTMSGRPPRRSNEAFPLRLGKPRRLKEKGFPGRSAAAAALAESREILISNLLKLFPRERRGGSSPSFSCRARAHERTHDRLRPHRSI